MVCSAISRARAPPSRRMSQTFVFTLGETGAAFAELSQVGIHISSEALFAIHAADCAGATFGIDHGDFFLTGEDLVQRVDIAHIRVAGIVTAQALRIGLHRHHALLGFLGGGGQLDMVIEAFAHLCYAVGADHLGNLGDLHLRLDEDIGAIAVVEGAHRLAANSRCGAWSNADGHHIGLVKEDVS